MTFGLRLRSFLFIIAAALFASAASCGTASEEASIRGETKLSIQTSEGSSAFTVEIARTIDEQRTGLMFRREMAADAGMLFDYRPTPTIQSIWMKNTLIPLDVIFIDENGIIVTVYENAEPRSLESMPATQPSVAVLELNGGTMTKIGAKVGDEVKHPWFDRN